MSDLKNKLSHLIEGQIPDYLRDSYPQFATFIKKYYEFLEQSHEANYLLLNSNKWSDVDLTLDMFVEKMREQHAYDISTNALLERKRLIKFINQYYEAKGSENAAELFFRMMYNDNASVKYPGDYVLRASDGKWIVKKTVKIDTDYLQINPVSFNLKPAATAQSASLSLFNLKDKQIYLKYNTIDNDGLQTFSIPIICLTVERNVNNSDIYQLEIDLARGTSIEDLNKLLSTTPYMETVWVTAFDDGTEYTYGFLSQQLIGYNILEGGENFRRRDTFEVEVSESLLYPIPGQEVNNGLVRVNSITNRDYGQFFAEDYAPLYGISDTQGIINGLSILNTGYRFDITGDYFAEAYTDIDDYTTYKTFERTLVNPRGSTDALVEFDVGYIYQRPGMWIDNSGFLSDMNKLQDNYYYQAFSYVIQTTAIPYHKWEHLYKLSAHPAGFKVFGELLVEHTVNFTPVDIESATYYTEMFIDGVFPIDDVVIHFYQANIENVHITNSYAPGVWVIDENGDEVFEPYFSEIYNTGDATTWLLEKPIDNEVVSDDTDYTFDIEKNILGITNVEFSDTIEKDIDVLYTDDYDADDAFDRVVDYNREFTEIEILTDTHVFDVTKSLDDNSVSDDVFDRVVDYIREFTEVEFLSDSISKDVEKSVIENNGYNINGYFSEEYAQYVGVIVTEDLLPEVTRIVDAFDEIVSVDESYISVDVPNIEDVNVGEVVESTYVKNTVEDVFALDTFEKDIELHTIIENVSILETSNISYTIENNENNIISDVIENEIGKNISEIVLYDDETISFAFDPNITENISNDEIIVQDLSKPIDESVINTEIVEKEFERNFLDSSNIIDNFIVVSTDISLSETVVKFDANAKHYYKPIDGSYYNEQAYFSEEYVYDISENLVSVDDERFLQNSLQKNENIILTENIVYQKQKAILENLLYGETFSFQYEFSTLDSINNSDALYQMVNKAPNETVNLANSDTVNRTLQTNFSDSSVLVENVSKSTNTIFTETIVKSDANAKHYYKPIDGSYYNEQGYFFEEYVYDISQNLVSVDDAPSIQYSLEEISDASTVSDSSVRSINPAFSETVITSTAIHYHNLQNNDELSDFDDNNHATDILASSLSTTKTETTNVTDAVIITLEGYVDTGYVDGGYVGDIQTSS